MQYVMSQMRCSIIHLQACLLTLDNLVQTHTVSNGNQVTVLNFMKDLLVNWTRSSRGKRFSESTKSLFATLSIRSMNATLLFSSIVGGPTRSTMKALSSSLLLKKQRLCLSIVGCLTPAAVPRVHHACIASLSSLVG